MRFQKYPLAEKGTLTRTSHVVSVASGDLTNFSHTSPRFYLGNLDYKQFTKRRRPHIDPPDATLFVTFRLAGSIPKSVVREYKAKRAWLGSELQRLRALHDNMPSPEISEWLSRVESFQREWFLKHEAVLHREEFGPTWMRDERVADKVAENLHRLDGRAYRLDAFSIMSNHVHTVFKPLLDGTKLLETWDEFGELLIESEDPGLAKIMFSLKGRSARECNLILGRTGSFWERESFDHVIRSGKFDKTVRYVLTNPIKVGLVRHWEDWRWNYCRKELVERFSTD
jgi:putative transposase